MEAGARTGNSLRDERLGRVGSNIRKRGRVGSAHQSWGRKRTPVAFRFRIDDSRFRIDEMVGRAHPTARNPGGSAQGMPLAPSGTIRRNAAWPHALALGALKYGRRALTLGVLRFGRRALARPRFC